MAVKMFYRTQRELSIALNELVDAYWNDEIDEGVLIESIRTMHENNQDKLIKDNEFTKVVQQQTGKRRLAIVHRILEME